MAAENVKITAEQFRTMKLDKRCELIDGEIVLMSPAPGFLHQKISGDIFFSIKSYILRNKGKCQVYAAPADVKLNDDTVVQPDIFVTCDPNRIDGQYHNGAPDWVIEILSPSTAGTDLGKKLYLYKSAGVREYWAVDPDEKRIIVYLFEGERSNIELYSFEDSISAGIYRSSAEPLVIRAADFFTE
ncbi:MAG: Uma2 family endonuclease [Oscillospiraceae bacterium]|nr:Uma2 family endonuclease [Oscillospiraceae bacterium]